MSHGGFGTCRVMSHVGKGSETCPDRNRCPSLEGYGPIDGVSMSGNVQGSVDKNSSAPPWRNTGQWMEFPCPEMCRGQWIKTPLPLPGGIQANGRSFHVWKCAGICG